MNPEVDAGGSCGRSLAWSRTYQGRPVGFQPNDPGDHQFDGPGIQIPAAAPKNRSRTPGRFRWFVSRGSTAFEIFRRGSPPDETEPGESCEMGRRISGSAIFDMV